MPIYSFKCSCGSEFDRFLKLSEYANIPDHCGQVVVRKVTAPYIQPDIPGFISPATGKWVEGRKAHAEDLKRSGCRIYEPGETEAFIRRKKDIEAAEDKEIDTLVEKTAAQLSI